MKQRGYIRAALNILVFRASRFGQRIEIKNKGNKLDLIQLLSVHFLRIYVFAAGFFQIKKVQM